MNTIELFMSGGDAAFWSNYFDHSDWFSVVYRAALDVCVSHGLATSLSDRQTDRHTHTHKP